MIAGAASDHAQGTWTAALRDKNLRKSQEEKDTPGKLTLRERSARSSTLELLCLRRANTSRMPLQNVTAHSKRPPALRLRWRP